MASAHNGGPQKKAALFYQGSLFALQNRLNGLDRYIACSS